MDIRKENNTNVTTDNKTDINKDNNVDDNRDASSPKSPVTYSVTFLYLMTFGVTLGACAYGYNLSSVSGAMLYVQPHFQLDSRWQVRHKIERSVCLYYVYLGMSICLYVYVYPSAYVSMYI